MTTILKRSKLVSASLLGLLLIGMLAGSAVGDTTQLKSLSTTASTDFANYQNAAKNRAFAIAPGGAWGWVADSPTMDIAEENALKRCRQFTEQPCYIYAVNDQVIFDLAAWNASWKLEGQKTLDTPRTGTNRGDVFPDLAFTTADGQPVTLSQFRGQVLFLHFWGSWCPPCKVEFPGIAKLRDSLVEESRIKFILLQVREPLLRSEKWMTGQEITLPLFDSGQKSMADDRFRLSNGNQIADREIAAVFPSTYILNSNGRVVFSVRGPIEDWSNYEALIRNAN